MTHPILFVGGTGVIGRQAVRIFRERHPHYPILIGGRDLAKATALAQDTGNATAVQIDADRPQFGFVHESPPGAVVMMTPDGGLNGLAYAQDLSVPYLSMGNWLVEVGAEMAHYIRRPDASPVVLASHWHAGPSVFLTQVLTRSMDKIHAVRVGAIVDDDDATGPAAIADMERGAAGGSGVWAFKAGRRVWLTGEEASRMLVTLDGRTIKGSAFSPYDIVSLQAATGAHEVRFDLASTISSSRLRGGDIATELIVEIEGETNGETCLRHATIEFDKGQATLTALGVVLALSAVLGFEGKSPFRPGLYFPEQILDADWYLDELSRAGAVVNISVS